VVSTVAGNGHKGVPEDGAEALKAPLVDPRAAAVDQRNNIYILERGGNALGVVDASGKVRTVAGTGSCPEGRRGAAQVEVGALIKYVGIKGKGPCLRGFRSGIPMHRALHCGKW
jgi:hypothetical protein